MIAEAIAMVEAGSVGGSGEIGTAFPVGECYLITARHVVWNDETDSPHANIKVSWIRVEGPKHQIEQTRSAEFELDLGADLGTGLDPSDVNPDDIDLVLLKCDVPPKYQNRFLLSLRPPTDNERWSTFGYAEVYANCDELRQTPASGVFDPVDPRSHQLMLGFDRGPDDHELWRGMSGAPLCIGSLILAVATELAPPDKRDKTFHATSMAWLLEKNPEFRKLVLPPPDRDILEQARRKLDQSPAACELLLQSARESGHDSKTVSACIECLTRISIADLVSIVQGAQSQLMKRNRADALVLGEFLSTLLPIKLDDPLAASIRQGKKEGKIGVVRMNSHATTVSAEMLMARADLRAACFRLEFIDAQANKGDKYLVPSENALELPPESGNSSSHSSKNIAIDIYQRYGGDASLARIEVRDHLYRSKVPPIGPEPDDVDEVIELVNDELQGRIRRGDPVLYLLVSYKSGNDPVTGADDWLSVMSKSFPSLGFVVLAGAHQDRRREHEDYRDLPLIDGFASD